MDLNKIKKSLQKSYGSLKTGDELYDSLEFVSTGNLAFDLISDGGIPFGHCTEFLGLSSSGKSLIIYNVFANAQKKYNAVCILVDRENAYSKQRGEELGIDNENLLICPPQDAVMVPNAFNFMMDTISAIRKSDIKTYIVLAIDSIAAFDQDTELLKSSTPRKAKDLHAAFRKFLPFLDERILLMSANQVTYKVGVLYGDPKTSASGEALKYYNQVRFALEDKRKIVDDKTNEVVGNWIGIEVIKTRLGPCYRTCYLKHLYETGIDYFSGYARLLAQRGYLEPKNKSEFKSFKQSTLKYKDKTVNENRIEAFLKEHPELLFSEYPPFKKDEVDVDSQNDDK